MWLWIWVLSSVYQQLKFQALHVCLDLGRWGESRARFVLSLCAQRPTGNGLGRPRVRALGHWTLGCQGEKYEIT